MRTKIYLIITSVILFLNCQILATPSDKIKSLIDSYDPHVNIGIKITNLDKNKVIYALNENRYFTFASALKFIAIKSIMDHYGENYQFESVISQDGQDLYLNIHDPNFSSDDLLQMLEEVKNKLSGKQINNFFIVYKSFLLPNEIRTRMAGDQMYCFGAPVSRVHINKNCSKLMATPTTVGKPIKVWSKETLTPYEISNNAITAPKHEPDFLRTSIKDGKFEVSGNLNHKTGEVPIAGVSQNPIDNVYYVLKALLQHKELALSGDIKIYFGNNLPGKVISHKSKSFKELAAIALKKSDNFMTDYFLAEYASKYGANEWAKAGLLLKKLVKQQYKINIDDSVIYDASGLSRNNLLTVNQFDSFLKAVAKQRNFKSLLPIMAIPGEDGTLKARLQGTDRIYSKTGGLSGVTSIVGYFYDKHDELHSFVVVINNFYGTYDEGDWDKYAKLREDILVNFISQ